MRLTGPGLGRHGVGRVVPATGHVKIDADTAGTAIRVGAVVFGDRAVNGSFVRVFGGTVSEAHVEGEIAADIVSAEGTGAVDVEAGGGAVVFVFDDVGVFGFGTVIVDGPFEVVDRFVVEVGDGWPGGPRVLYRWLASSRNDFRQLRRPLSDDPQVVAGR